MAPKFPAKLGACIDLAYKLQKDRLALQKEQEAALEKMKEKERAIEQYIIDSFDAAAIEAARGEIATAALNKVPYPTLKDPIAFFKYLQKTGEFDLIEKRVAKNAYRERIEAKKVVPGVETFWKKSLSLNKR